MRGSVDTEFMFTLGELFRLIRVYADKEAARYGITRAQWAVLSKVERQEGLKQTELAELRSRIEHANDLADDDRRAISRQLDRIERTMDRICDRMDTDARIGTALARMNRPEGD